jgi:hypothetical protein
MKKLLLLVGIILALATGFWMLASESPAVPIRARLLSATNSDGGTRFCLVAVTNLTGQGVFISGHVEKFGPGSLDVTPPRENSYVFWKDLPAHKGTWVNAKVASPNKQILISYERHSAWNDFRRRTARWLPNRFRPSSSVIPYKHFVVIDFPPE